MEYIAGTILKLNISLKYGDINMDGFWFSCDFYTDGQKVETITKPYDNPTQKIMKRVDDSHYIAFVDTTDMATGRLKMKVTANATDTDNPKSGEGRKVIKVYKTDIVIHNE